MAQEIPPDQANPTSLENPKFNTDTDYEDFIPTSKSSPLAFTPIDLRTESRVEEIEEATRVEAGGDVEGANEYGGGVDEFEDFVPDSVSDCGRYSPVDFTKMHDFHGAKDENQEFMERYKQFCAGADPVIILEPSSTLRADNGSAPSTFSSTSNIAAEISNKCYNRGEMVVIGDSRTHQQWADFLVENHRNDWKIDKHPFELDSELRCPLNIQFRVRKEREQADRLWRSVGSHPDDDPSNPRVSTNLNRKVVKNEPFIKLNKNDINYKKPDVRYGQPFNWRLHNQAQQCTSKVGTSRRTNNEYNARLTPSYHIDYKPIKTTDAIGCTSFADYYYKCLNEFETIKKPDQVDNSNSRPTHRIQKSTPILSVPISEKSTVHGVSQPSTSATSDPYGDKNSAFFSAPSSSIKEPTLFEKHVAFAEAWSLYLEIINNGIADLET